MRANQVPAGQPEYNFNNAVVSLPLGAPDVGNTREGAITINGGTLYIFLGGQWNKVNTAPVNKPTTTTESTK